MSARLGSHIMDRSDVLPTTQFSNRKSMGSCNALCVRPRHGKVHSRVDRRPGLCRLTSAQPLMGSTIKEFSISSALCMGIECSVLSILTESLSNRSQQALVEGC